MNVCIGVKGGVKSKPEYLILKQHLSPRISGSELWSRGPIGGGRSLGSGDHRTIEAPLSPPPLTLWGGSFLDYSHMVAKLKLKGIDGRAYCGTAVLLSVPCFAQGRRRPFTT